MIRIYPSIIAADLLNLEHEIKRFEPYCDGYHIDIMDNHFVPNLTLGADFVRAINNVTAKPLWVQLMVDNPEIWVDLLSLNANSILSFHIESSRNTRKIISHIKEKNIVASLAVNPNTPVEQIFPFLDILDHVLIMSVEPGFSGQSFLPEVVDKVDILLAYCQMRNFKCVVGMDGGIGPENIGMLAKQGVSDFGIGSAIFNQSDPIQAIQDLYKLAS